MALIKAALEVGPAKWNFAWGIWSRGRRGNLEGGGRRGKGGGRGESGVEIHLIGFGVTKTKTNQICSLFVKEQKFYEKQA